MKRILVIDDELSMPPAAAEFRRAHGLPGYSYRFVATREQALKQLDGDEPYCMVLLDMRFSAISSSHGLEILADLGRMHPEIPVIVMSSRREPEILIRAWELGARSYIVKWSDNPNFQDELEDRVTKHARRSRRDTILGRSAPLTKLRGMITLVADHDSTVLVEGETGTGKELVAESLHHQGPRNDKPLVKVDCAALPSNLVESELFGHRKGAFTDASADHRGKVEEADGGILFLDEIGELLPEVQSKFLRFLDRKEFTRIGDTRTKTVDVQIIAATNRDLDEEVRSGRFRLDLLQRLKLFTIRTPPLRECRDDIPALAEYFLDRLLRRKPKPVEGFSVAAMEALVRFDWPGNVRQLSHVVERAFILTGAGRIEPDSFPDEVRRGPLAAATDAALDPDGSLDLKKHLARVGWSLLRDVYRQEIEAGKRGVRGRVAQRLGLNPVNGFSRKVAEIRRCCPELEEEIDSFLEG